MAKFNQLGQWVLSGDEEHLLFKTDEEKSSGKGELIEHKKVDPNSEEAKAIFDRLAKAIIEGRPPQPTNEQLFGCLVPTEEQVRKAEFEWENRIQLGYEAAVKPIDPDHQNKEWGNGKSFKDQLTDEEFAKYMKEENDFDKRNR